MSAQAPGSPLGLPSSAGGLEEEEEESEEEVAAEAAAVSAPPLIQVNIIAEMKVRQCARRCARGGGASGAPATPHPPRRRSRPLPPLPCSQRLKLPINDDSVAEYYAKQFRSGGVCECGGRGGCAGGDGGVLYHPPCAGWGTLGVCSTTHHIAPASQRTRP